MIHICCAISAASKSLNSLRLVITGFGFDGGNGCNFNCKRYLNNAAISQKLSCSCCSSSTSSISEKSHNSNIIKNRSNISLFSLFLKSNAYSLIHLIRKLIILDLIEVLHFLK
eukprot:NODE_679_length_5285_cov_0.261088.p3 type:complete len:113 gc:universal NODE_679_length_5285_cov_0.261088:3482-3144(-)